MEPEMRIYVKDGAVIHIESSVPAKIQIVDYDTHANTEDADGIYTESYYINEDVVIPGLFNLPIVML